MRVSGEIYVMRFKIGDIDIDTLREIFEKTRKAVAPTPVIALPDCVQFDGMSKSECMNMLLDMMECVQSG